MNRRAALVIIMSSAGVLLTSHARLKARIYDEKRAQKRLNDADQISRQLQDIVGSSSFTGHIPAQRAEQLATSAGKNMRALMLDLIPLARTYSRPPISNYHVGAVALGASGSLYLGMNIEIPGHTLGFSVHGEQAALSNAYMHDEQAVSAVAVSAAPCGHCRQFMNEMAPSEQLEILVSGAPAVKLSSLLPMSFGPRDLGYTGGAFPPPRNALANKKAVSDELTNVALTAARQAYAPYTRAPSGVALLTNKKIHKGSYLENVAFNPSLSPLQTALVQLILAGQDFKAIARVILAELQDASISQASATRTVLDAIAPGVELEVAHLVRA